MLDGVGTDNFAVPHHHFLFVVCVAGRCLEQCIQYCSVSIGITMLDSLLEHRVLRLPDAHLPATDVEQFRDVVFVHAVHHDRTDLIRVIRQEYTGASRHYLPMLVPCPAIDAFRWH